MSRPKTPKFNRIGIGDGAAETNFNPKSSPKQPPPKAVPGSILKRSLPAESEEALAAASALSEKKVPLGRRKRNNSSGPLPPVQNGAVLQSSPPSRTEESCSILPPVEEGSEQEPLVTCDNAGAASHEHGKHSRREKEVLMMRRTAPMPQNPDFYMDLMLGTSAFMSTSRNLDLQLLASNLQHALAANLVPVPVLLPPGTMSLSEPVARIDISQRKCGRWAAVHWDYVLEEMKFMWMDFRMERRRFLENRYKLGRWARWEWKRRGRERGFLVGIEGGCSEVRESLVGDGEVWRGSWAYVHGESGWICGRDVQGENGEWVRLRRWFGYGYQAGRRPAAAVDGTGRVLGKPRAIAGSEDDAKDTLPLVQLEDRAVNDVPDHEVRDSAAMANTVDLKLQVLRSDYHTPEPANTELDQIVLMPRPSTPLF